jgi:SAM-dependent methyltransferase
MIQFSHPLPAARFVGSRDSRLLHLCRGKTVLHLGFVDEGLLEERWRERAWLHAELARVGARVVGVDISAEGVGRAVAAGYRDCYVGDAEKLSQAAFPRLQYDVILAADIIEHLANPGCFLRELQTLMTPRMRLVLTTPNALSIKTVFFALARIEAVHSDHNFYFSPTTLATLLRKHDFDVSAIELYASVWGRNRRKRASARQVAVRSLFTAMDAMLRYSVVPLFPYYSEGMLIQARKRSLEMGDQER